MRILELSLVYLFLFPVIFFIAFIDGCDHLKNPKARRVFWVPIPVESFITVIYGMALVVKTSLCECFKTQEEADGYLAFAYTCVGLFASVVALFCF